MKKREITKIIKSAAVVSLSACLLVGCGNGGTENGSEKVVEETSAVEAAENDAAEEQGDTADSQTNEAASDETTDKESDEAAGGEDETASDTTTEASDTTADPGEVTYVTDFTSIDDYMDGLGSEKPAIVIYNQQEGYLINMQEGQHYQMKKTDELFLNFQDAIGYGMNLELVDGGYQPVDHNYTIANLNLDKFTDNQEFYIIDPNDNKITCYLTPPLE